MEVVTADWQRILGANFATASALYWSFRLGRWSCPCDQLPDPDAWYPGCEWTANPDASPRPRPPCSCSDEEGDSRCARHPTRADCGCSIERGEERCFDCDGCTCWNVPSSRHLDEDGHLPQCPAKPGGPRSAP